MRLNENIYFYMYYQKVVRMSTCTERAELCTFCINIPYDQMCSFNIFNPVPLFSDQVNSSFDTTDFP